MPLPLQNLQENKFLSSRHRSHFLAFAQNALSNKKRNLETISIHELIRTITLQFEALRLKESMICNIAPENLRLQIDCDMYLLGGAMANLMFACMLETQDDKSPFTFSFNRSAGTIQVLYKKSSGTRLSEGILTRYKHWHQHPANVVDASTSMLILAENAIKQHHGQFSLNMSSDSDALLEITLPLSPSSQVLRQIGQSATASTSVSEKRSVCWARQSLA